MIGHERLTFTQIIMSRGTEIKSSTANMEKRLTYMYILPWTTLGRPKNDHWAPRSLLGELVARWAKMTDQNYSICVVWANIWHAQRVTCLGTSILGLVGRE